jgi:hypothetical protein
MKIESSSDIVRSTHTFVSAIFCSQSPAYGTSVAIVSVMEVHLVLITIMALYVSYLTAQSSFALYLCFGNGNPGTVE